MAERMTLKELSPDQLFSGVVLLACVLILTLVYGQTSIGFYRLWVAENSLQSHGLLLLPLSYYLLAREWYSRRHELQISFRPILLLLLVILSVIWLLSEIAQIQVGSQMVLIMILSVSVMALFGIKHTARMVLPILVLISATSVWSVLSQPLQVPTAVFVNQMLHFTGYASFQESYFITIPEGVFEVGDTCSGLRYQIAAITLAIIYSFFSHYSIRHAVIYMLLASGVAFISNSIRIYIVVLSGHYTNMTHSLLNDHIWLGWVVFVICYAAFMYATVSYEKRLKGEQKQPVIETGKVPVTKFSYSKTILIASVLLISASAGPIYSVIAMNGDGMRGSYDFDFSFGEINLTEVTADERWNPAWVNADFEKRTAYQVAGINAELYTAYYATQEQGKEAVNDLNQAYNSEEWVSSDRVILDINLSAGRTISVSEETIVDSKRNERIIWQWYYIGGEISSSRLQSKLYGILGALKGRHDAAVVVISTDKTGDGTLERESMMKFTDLVINKIEQHYSAQKN
ncbi:EpsI family protein [Candidatus Thiodiazotropha endoloripes]|nr:EpsI family protein [Candidatus Thiodiazotropha endoloripes]